MNNMHIWRARFGCIASLQIACAAELLSTLCILHCIPNPTTKSNDQMHSLFMNKPYVAEQCFDAASVYGRLTP